MNTARVKKIDPKRILAEDIEATARCLEQGELVVAPTETRYGLLVRGDSPEGIRRLYGLKGRSSHMPTALFVRNREDLDRFGIMNTEAAKLASAFLPGPLTLVLSARVQWDPPRVVDGKVGLRWSSSPVIEHLTLRLPFPITATSANRTGEELETIEQIAEAFGDAVALYLDGGPLSGPASTVVDCTGEGATILRPGAIRDQLIFEELTR